MNEYIADKQNIVRKYLSSNPNSSMEDIQGPYTHPLKDYYDAIIKPMVDSGELKETKCPPYVKNTSDPSYDPEFEKLRDKRFSITVV